MDQKATEYFEKQKSPQKEICKKLRKILLEFCEEEMKWGVPAYCNGKYYIVALKDSINLGFSIKGLKKEQLKLFDGWSRTMVHLKFYTEKNIDKKE